MTEQIMVVDEKEELFVKGDQESLVFIKDNKVVTDSLTVAELLKKQHKHVLRDIKVQMEKLESAGEGKFTESNFGLSFYKDVTGRTLQKIDMTEDAFTILMFSYNTIETMKIKVRFIEEFKRMRAFIENRSILPTDTFGQIELIAAGTSNLNKRVSSLEQVVEKQLTVDYGQQRVIEKTKAKRIYFLWENGHVDREVHDSTRKLFGLLGRNLKDAFNVNSYRDILKKDFEEALNFVSGWRPMV
ncbi:Rha family transcriptional regulator [Bacillus cereus]|uniref:Rha family transcriptional regulator n=1 Tax=Bacillus cereus group TaxID=86661 RepID=UPI00077A39EF|nr:MULTISPECIES: Rha family transcriptional regulator [Bacillus cereus group]KXY40481.1 Rha family transcriptional regulator [Bacillus cereus]MCP9227212.1 Rha family transcriptional regulator [Bacillus mycoides]OOR67562.1 Rha family transcriptional regulator [Bacillus mycoides]OOR67620.1 Rha family transcriptional regulator [Bacillus mycoides]